MALKILGLDLGTNSIGWALVREAENENEQSEIIKLGVRVNPLTVDEKTNFEKGRPLSTNADRTSKRSARRNLQRFKLRRENLIKILIQNKLIKECSPLTEIGENSTYQTLEIRAKAARDRIELEELVRVFLAINKKRGYKSSRKVKSEDEGVAIDGMKVAKHLYDNNLTPGEYVYSLLKNGKKYIPDFYRSDLKNEFDKVWNFQKQFYPEILDDELYTALDGQGQQNSRKRFLAIKGIYTAENKGKRDEVKLQHYKWRAEAISQKLSIEEVAYVLVEINNNLNQSSGYLGAISDRSKELYFNKETVGEYLWKSIQENRHKPLKNQVFYRQDYLDEFEQIWETQAKFHPELTDELKEEIRDVIIFYQRKLKSQKSILSFCQFESKEVEAKDNDGNVIINKTTKKPKMQTIGRRVIAKSSPLFQEFKIWQNLNNLEFSKIRKTDENEEFELDLDTKKELFKELNLRGNLTQKEVLKFLGLSDKIWKTNFANGLEGNRTNEMLFNVYRQIAEYEGYGHDWEKKTNSEIVEELEAVFKEIGIKPEILHFDATKKEGFDKQPSFQLWHLLYSAEEDGNKINEEDKLIFGNSSVKLKKKLVEKFGFKPEHTKWLASLTLPQDYGNLSSKAIREIIPHLIKGNNYSDACKLAGYNHSHSVTKEENENRELDDKLDILPKNSLRNPVVEKILNQMVNVINEIIDTYGKPDEVRIELARELKKNAKERKELSEIINKNTKENEEIRKTIIKEFGIPNPTKNDIIRYRLFLELGTNAHNEIFTGKPISHDILFSKNIEIEHIIPKALLFDDSFSNKTLAFSSTNKQKDNRTAMNFITKDFSSQVEEYKQRVEMLYEKGSISRTKRNKLLMLEEDLPKDFIERDLRNSQYIAREAKKMLFKVFREVTATSGAITDRLRSDWDLVNVMKELNFPKYKALGLTEIEQRFDTGREELKEVEVITNWTKRNDHRHHAMDALTVAFTTHNHIQYINNLNARKDEAKDNHIIICNIEDKITRVENRKRKFIPPMPHLRSEAKKHIESILISIKAKNKVVTKNLNYTKGGNSTPQVTLTPRGQLHKETVYGKIKLPMDKATKLNKNISLEQIEQIVNPTHKQIVLDHIAKFGNNPSKAFDSKNLKKTPILYKNEPLTDVICFEEIYTIRKDISPDLKIEKVIDPKIREILKNRKKEFGGDAKKAFSDLDTNPIWLNKEKGICIKRVTITGVNNVETLHHKKDHLGKTITNKNGKKLVSDFVSTGNNHHIAIYRDKDGNLQDNVVSFFEAVERVNQGLPIIDKKFNQDLGWEFLFTMKQNEMFVFPNDDFDINDIDLLEEKNYHLISKHLYRVQTISKVEANNSFVRDFMFRHHLETNVSKVKELKDIAYKQVKSLNGLEGIVKVRINHIGKIVSVGEY
ncbi:type II CRISPR RNA-guided endonuclease Cas9 [Ornithobacterium rhinotracheale]